ncbi:hypothetical protein J437_LFUL009382 [Ladona fulva]|uniref:Uncharacterized protein n=1 Tax=Ladona fulva TaxID=123851 RepID=A0A8K0P0B8_LADFU|nr:hypothetical protein J437_LFUL009382 [Ladona fulva]
MATGSAPNIAPSLPPKSYITTCTTYNLACNGCPENSKYVLFSNKIIIVLDFLLQRLSGLIPSNRQHTGSGGSSSSTLKAASGAPTVDPVAGALMRLLSLVLSSASSEAPSGSGDAVESNSSASVIEDQRIQDVIW